jgi:hypothetical protein
MTSTVAKNTRTEDGQAGNMDEAGKLGKYNVCIMYVISAN